MPINSTYITAGIIGVTIIVAGLLLIWLYERYQANQAPAKARKLEGALRDEKVISSIILSAIEDGVVLLDAEGNIQSFNKGASEMTGWSQSEAQSLRCDSVFRLEDERNTPYTVETNPFNRIFKEGTTIHDDRAIMVTRSDKRIAISISLSPVTDEAGKVTAAVAIFRDVSDARAQEASRAEFISTASHEMRTPVAAIEGYLALALNDKVATIDDRARNYLTKAHSSTQHLGKLFQDLLTSSKAEDGRLSSHPVVTEMGSLLQHLTDDLKFSAQKKGLFAEFIMGSSDVIDASAGANLLKPLYFVHADPDRLREVITNLFDNACKYTESGKVTIGLTANDDVVQFYVRDTGSGIPAEDLPHLFQKFYRVDSSATRTIGGTGLGLFICRKIIELYAGRIWVESEVGKGSTFFVNLPRISTQRAETMRAAEAGSNQLPAINSLTGSVLQ
jgi:PAS domain S-box-containing protein